MRDLQVPADLQEFTSFGAAINLYTTPANARWACQLEIVAGSGTITCKMAGSVGVARVLTVAAGDILYGQFLTIDSVSGVTRVRAGWN